jgi:adenylate kinase family enzyme
LSAALAIPHIELDALHWADDWQALPVRTFRERVLAAARSDSWILDGNYKLARDLLWHRATHVVWLDPSLPRALLQTARRSLRRCITRERLWATQNVETFALLVSRDSPIAWTWRSHRALRLEFASLAERASASGIEVTRLQTRADIESLVSHSKYMIPLQQLQTP